MKHYNSEFVFFLLILFSNILITGTFYPLIYLVAALMHEAGHILAMRLMGYSVDCVKFVGFGIRIKNKNIYSYRQEIIISLMGPAINILLGFCGVLLYLEFKNELLGYFVLSNFLYAFINLLPLSPLDGYKILSNIIHLKCSFEKSKIVIKITTVCMTLILLSMIFLFKNNLSFLLITCVLLISAVFQLFEL